MSQNKPVIKIHATKSEELLKTVTVRAESVGMRVNNAKTQLLCLHASNSSEVTSYMKIGSTKIESGEELKILGFIFGKNPTVKPHVNYMLGKARKKLWALRHVKKAGLDQSDLLKIFNTVIRSTLEFAVPTYHPMLSNDLCDNIESIQKRASKIIFGWNSNYDELVNSGRIETLQCRRERLTLNFAKKAASDPRVCHWFPKRNYGDLNLRREAEYEEHFARTERLKMSPLYYMQRALNATSSAN